MNPEHGAGRDPINVINDPLFTYTRARIPVYPPEKKFELDDVGKSQHLPPSFCRCRQHPHQLKH